ncbi:hypothetical protein OJ998_36040 [Solirubrobacter taibaiensis]|nr:hypothetical protein [Solirubrobacter taibaiensis]
MRAKITWSLLLPALLAALGCGATPDRFALTTPADPRAVSTPVSVEEQEILRHWGEQLRVRDASGASRDFEVPALVSNGESGWVELADRKQIENFNRNFTCGAELLETWRRADGFVVGSFRLVEQPGANQCGARTGRLRAIAVKIEGHRISRWLDSRGPALSEAVRARRV